MPCARTRYRIRVNGSHHDVGTRAVVKSRGMHAPLQRILSICRVGDCCDQLESVHAGGVHEICENPDTILSELLMLTRLDLPGSSCCLTRIAHRSSSVHRRPLLRQSAVRPHTAQLSWHAHPTFISSPQSVQNNIFVITFTQELSPMCWKKGHSFTTQVHQRCQADNYDIGCFARKSHQRLLER